MAMEFFNNNINNGIVQNPYDQYHDFAQAVFDELWEDTTQIRVIKEQSYPFIDEYTEYEARVDTVSEFSVNTNKMSGDFIKVIYRDIDHPLNHKGQKYKYKTDGTNEEWYLCYDRLNDLNLTPDFKCIRCNNYLTFIKNGKIIKEPCSIGYEMTSTNANVTKDATVAQRRLVCLVQGNDNTKDFEINQKFILQHKQAFKITEVNILQQENNMTEDVTMYTMYIEWIPITSNDNLELNLADYYNSVYDVEINSSNLSLVNGDTGQLTATVKLNDETQSNIDISWSTSDSSVISIDSLGNYQVTGSDGSTATIRAYIDGNEIIYDEITIDVVAIATDNKEIVINPTVMTGRLLEGLSVNISYGVYNNDVLTTDIVTVTPSGASASDYSLTYGTNIVTVTNINKSSIPLTLTFESGILTPKILEITLGGIL
ncbi:MAG: hypothetical protein BV457_09390 [Thermoplasmata archaeon M9B1D]|nr:MAG: hypothetical protein BV457_09390 [Thermoplasmata archaeon M9B1D]